MLQGLGLRYLLTGIKTPDGPVVVGDFPANLRAACQSRVFSNAYYSVEVDC